MRDLFHKSCFFPPKSLELPPFRAAGWSQDPEWDLEPSIPNSPREGSNSDWSHPPIFNGIFCYRNHPEKVRSLLTNPGESSRFENSNCSRNWKSFLELQHYSRQSKPTGASVSFQGKGITEQPSNIFSPRANSGKRARTGPRIPKKASFHSQKCWLPSLPEGRCFPARVSKEQEESELRDKVTMATEAGIQEC